MRQIDAKLREESHIRAFISHFKIELNKLMELRWAQSSSGGLDTPSDDEPMSFVVCRVGSSNDQPTVTISGPHSGLYETGQQSNNDSFSSDLTPEDDDDDGYRTMSREGLHPIVLQHLSEIKSRLIDLVHEIDQVVGPKIDASELESYRRRWNALATMLDDLIDNCSKNYKSETKARIRSARSEIRKQSPQMAEDLSLSSRDPKNLTNNNHKTIVARYNSDSNIHSSDGYEEQVEVIDYGCRRRASDSRASERSTKPQTTSNGFTGPSLRDQPIDFGAMMREYEAGQTVSRDQDSSLTDEQSGKKNSNHHNSSYSSTSCYSASTHTSSSSFL